MDLVARAVRDSSDASGHEDVPASKGISRAKDPAYRFGVSKEFLK